MFATCSTQPILFDCFLSSGFYSPYRTLAFLNGLIAPQTFGRTPWLGDQSNTSLTVTLLIFSEQNKLQSPSMLSPTLSQIV
jgi:hypothetical protein